MDTRGTVMPNYAYRASAQPLNMNPFTQMMANNPPFTTGFYNDNPDLAYQSFVNTPGFSISQRDMLQRIFESLKSQWTNKQWNDQIAGNPMTSFTDFLGKYNFGQEFGNASPSLRRENPGNFNRQTRVVNF